MLLGYWELTDGHQFWLHLTSRKSYDTLPVSLEGFSGVDQRLSGFFLGLRLLSFIFQHLTRRWKCTNVKQWLSRSSTLTGTFSYRLALKFRWLFFFFVVTLGWDQSGSNWHVVNTTFKLISHLRLLLFLNVSWLTIWNMSDMPFPQTKRDTFVMFLHFWTNKTIKKLSTKRAFVIGF